MAHAQKQLEIMDYMVRFDLSETTIAKWIGMKPNKLSYQLNNAIEVKDEYYKAIKDQLIKRKYLSDQDECQKLFDLTSGFLQSLTTQFSLFSNEVSRTIKNKIIEVGERPRLRTKYDDLKEQVERFDEEMKKLGI
ncbi:MAG: hypothetical protein WC879_03580 [Melioribacteraceae bacterium]